MRRVMMVVGMAFLLACMAAGVAAAAERFNEKDCNDVLPCNGTNRDDLMHERQGTVKDVIYGKDGHDVLDANNFNKDRDRLFGGDQGDKILANDGDGRDVAKGGGGRDICYVDRGDRTVNCNVVRRDGRDGLDYPKDVAFLK